jgi:hypothetical protein
LLCPRRSWCQGISPSILGSVLLSQGEMPSVVAFIASPYKSWSYTHEGWNEDLLFWSFM